LSGKGFRDRAKYATLRSDGFLEKLRQRSAARKAASGFRTSAARREVTAFADEVTILRRGKLAGYGRVADLSPTTWRAP